MKWPRTDQNSTHTPNHRLSWCKLSTIQFTTLFAVSLICVAISPSSLYLLTLNSLFGTVMKILLPSWNACYCFPCCGVPKLSPLSSVFFHLSPLSSSRCCHRRMTTEEELCPCLPLQWFPLNHHLPELDLSPLLQQMNSFTRNE